VTAAPELDAEHARLLIAPATLATLVAHAADPVNAALAPRAADELSRLQEAGVIDGGRLHPALAGPLGAIVDPGVCTLELSEGDRVARAWVGYDDAAVVLAPRDGRHAVLGLHPTLVPAAVARLAGLGPRPRPAATAPVAPDSLAGVTRRWRLTAEWRTAAGPGGTELEVADTDAGLWLVAPGATGEPAATPTDPTTVWRATVRAIMRRRG
jgi:hypothetical protein